MMMNSVLSSFSLSLSDSIQPLILHVLQSYWLLLTGVGIEGDVQLRVISMRVMKFDDRELLACVEEK